VVEVRVVKAWKHYQPGRLLQVTGGVANVLLRRGIVELLTERPTFAKRTKNKRKGSRAT